MKSVWLSVVMVAGLYVPVLAGDLYVKAGAGEGGDGSKAWELGDQGESGSLEPSAPLGETKAEVGRHGRGEPRLRGADGVPHGATVGFGGHTLVVGWVVGRGGGLGHQLQIVNVGSGASGAGRSSAAPRAVRLSSDRCGRCRRRVGRRGRYRRRRCGPGRGPVACARGPRAG